MPPTPIRKVPSPNVVPATTAGAVNGAHVVPTRSVSGSFVRRVWTVVMTMVRVSLPVELAVRRVERIKEPRLLHVPRRREMVQVVPTL
jgi:hypothetical protein